MENERNARQFFDFFYPGYIQARRFFISSVRRADHYGERGYARFFRVFFGFVGIGILGRDAFVPVGGDPYMTQFALDSDAERL